MKARIIGGDYIKDTNDQFSLQTLMSWFAPGHGLKYAAGCIEPLFNDCNTAWFVGERPGAWSNGGALNFPNFICDGCTMWPDGFLGILKYRRACFIHDFLCRHVIKNHADRYEADRLLMYLVGGAMGRVMFVGVRAYSKYLEAQGRLR